jgi:hypothetical protein
VRTYARFQNWYFEIVLCFTATGVEGNIKIAWIDSSKLIDEDRVNFGCERLLQENEQQYPALLLRL